MFGFPITILFVVLSVCQNVAYDIVFIVDSSGSVGPANFELAKRFVGDVISRLDIGSSATRVGVIDYADSVENVFFLNR